VNRWGLSRYLLAGIVFLVLIDPPVAFPREDTAYIVFKRMGVSRDHADVYVVKKGECLFDIVRSNYAVSRTETFRLLELVGELNPQIRDINVIYPGQRVFLPRKRSSDEVPPGHSLSGKESEKDALKYVVRRGDSISNIIHRLGSSSKDIYRVVEKVRRLNPTLKNIDRIYPGQIILFPSGKRREVRPTVRDEAVGIPEEKILPVISHVIDRMQGVVITEGRYCIPVPPSGEVKIDCSKVPVIETDGGNTILLDLSDRIPADLKELIESTWNTYRVVDVRETEAISSLLERIVGAAGIYTLEKINRQTEIGSNPAVRVFTGWRVSKRPETRGISRYAINFVTERSALLPLPVKDYVQKNGLEIIEVMDGLGITSDGAAYQSFPVQTLDATNGLVLANSLLRTLGYAPVKDAEITVLIGEGLSLSVQTELLLDVEGTRIIITSRPVSGQILSILKERGDKVVFVSEEKGNREIIEGITRSIGLPVVSDDFQFSLSRHTGKERGAISLPALRIKGDGELYLVDYDVDSGIRELLHEEWKVQLVQY